MAKQKYAAQRTRLELNLLQPNPLQTLYYADESEADDADLAADLATNGQREPIVVMPPGNQAGWPDYAILDGHRRRRALEANGETTGDVLIRNDLLEVDAAKVEEVFLAFNFTRRQLHPLDKARVALRLYQLEKKRPRGKLYRCDELEARDRIGRLLGMSGRNLQRYFRLLLTPLAVQRAFRDGQLSLVLGEQVEGLTENQQTAIARRIQAGEDPQSVVRDYITPHRGRHVKPVQALHAFVRGLARGLKDLDGRVDQLRGRSIAPHRATLTEAHHVIGQLLNQVVEDSESTADLAALKDLAERARRST